MTVDPVRALCVVGHPERGSFSHAMADAACDVLAARGVAIDRHDLYAEGFDPVQRTGERGNVASDDALVERHCTELVAADLVLVFHPNWWGQPPAMLKGWIDRVFRLGTAYGYPPGVDLGGAPVGLLKARCAFVFNTSNTPAEREADAFGDPLERIWRDAVFGFCGVGEVVRRMVGPMAGSSAAERAAWLEAVRADVARAA